MPSHPQSPHTLTIIALYRMLTAASHREPPSPMPPPAAPHAKPRAYALVLRGAPARQGCDAEGVAFFARQLRSVRSQLIAPLEARRHTVDVFLLPSGTEPHTQPSSVTSHGAAPHHHHADAALASASHCAHTLRNASHASLGGHAHGVRAWHVLPAAADQAAGVRAALDWLLAAGGAWERGARGGAYDMLLLSRFDVGFKVQAPRGACTGMHAAALAPRPWPSSARAREVHTACCACSARALLLATAALRAAVAAAAGGVALLARGRRAQLGRQVRAARVAARALRGRPPWPCTLRTRYSRCEPPAWERVRCVNDLFVAVPRRLVRTFAAAVGTTSAPAGRPPCDFNECFLSACPGANGHGCHNVLRRQQGGAAYEDGVQFCWAQPARMIREPNDFFSLADLP